MQMNRVRVVLTGVAGSPAYMNFYTNNGLVSASLAHSVVATLMFNLKAQWRTSVQYLVEGDVALVESTTDTIIGVTSIAPVSGAGSSSSNSQVPLASQVLVRFLTGAYAGGRQVRGRLFLPYFISSNMDVGSGGVVAATVTNVNTHFNTYLTAFAPNGAVVYSRKNGTGYAISAASTWNQWAVMRSRRD